LTALIGCVCDPLEWWSVKAKMCVYSITHRASGRIYIGQTKGFVVRRWQAHCAPSRREVIGIVGAIKKHGRDAFDFRVLRLCSSADDLDAAEIAVISDLNTISPFGFNFESGGNCKKTVSEETRDRMRKSRKAWLESGADTSTLGNGSRGRKRRPEEISAIRAGLNGRPVSAETRQRISSSQAGRSMPKERVLRMARARMKGRVVMVEDGRSFLSFTEAVEGLGLSKANIFAAASGRNKSCGGLRLWLEVA
jgi:group I intron endonuclease